MPVFTIELPNGKLIDAEAANEAAALSGAQDWYKQQNPPTQKPLAHNTSLNINGHSVTVDDNFLKLSPDQQNTTVDEIAKSLPKAAQANTSVTGALQQGASDLISGVGSTVKNLISKDAGKAVEDAAKFGAPKNYKSATQEFMRPSDGADKHWLGVDWASAPRALLEQAPSLAMDLAAQGLLKRFGPLAQIAGGSASFGLRSAGNEIQKRADARTGVEGSEPNTTDKVVGVGSTALQGALNAYAANKIVSPSKVTGTGMIGVGQVAGNVGKAALAEGATNAVQEGVSQVVSTAGTDKGVTVDPTTIKGAAILGGLGGGVFGAGRGVRDTAQAIQTRGMDAGEHTTHAANRVLDKAGSTKALEDPKTAYSSVQGAKADVSRELSDVSKTITAPSTETANALARAKRGDALNTKELAAIDAEGNDTLSSLVRQSSALTKLTQRGNFDPQSERFAGGVSEMVRSNAGKLAVAAGGVGSLPHIAANGIAGADGLAAALPGVGQALAGAYGGYKGLKAVERFAGITSPARTFAEKFSDATGQLRPDVQLNQSPTGPKVNPTQSLTTPQPWGPVAPKPTPFKPDILEPGLQKIVDKLQNQKRRDTVQGAMPLLRELADRTKPAPEAPGIDASAINEQIKGALLMASARRKMEGQRAAEAEAEASPMIQEQGGLDAVRNPAMGKRANELISAANALARLRRQTAQDEETPPVTPSDDQPPTPPQWDGGPQAGPEQPQAQQPNGPQGPTLPKSPYWSEDPADAAKLIYKDLVDGGFESNIRHPEHYKAGIRRRLEAEQDIYLDIVNKMDRSEYPAFHKYGPALWGSDSPPIAKQVRDSMLAEFPQHAETINSHLSDKIIDELWKPPTGKKAAPKKQPSQS